MASGSNRLLTIGTAVGSLALLTAAVFVLWPADPDLPLLSEREQSNGETVGWVSKLESNRIHVNAGPFGGGVLPLEVTKNTRITAGTKEGWFEDIRLGGQVKVVYDVYNGRRLARTVELLVDDGPRRPIRPEPRVKNAGAPVERVPAKPSVATSSTPDARPAPAPKAAEPPPATPPAEKPPAAPPVAKAPEPAPAVVTAPTTAPPARPAAPTSSTPEPRPAPKAETAPAPRAAAPPARSAAPAESSARVPDPVRASATAPAAPSRPAAPAISPEGGDSSDGSAAVDWFLKNRR